MAPENLLLAVKQEPSNTEPFRTNASQEGLHWQGENQRRALPQEEVSHRLQTGQHMQVDSSASILSKYL